MIEYEWAKPKITKDPNIIIYRRPDGGSGNQTGHVERSKANDTRPRGHRGKR